MSNVVTDISNLLREAERRRLERNLDLLIEKHMEASNSSVMGFIHEGLCYRHNNAPKGKLNYQAIHPSVEPDMRLHVQQHNELEANLQEIRQALLPIVRLCLSDQDLRDALPDCIITMFKTGGATKLHRTRKPAWVLEEGSRAMEHYQRVLPNIEFYSAARLIY